MVEPAVSTLLRYPAMAESKKTALKRGSPTKINCRSYQDKSIGLGYSAIFAFVYENIYKIMNVSLRILKEQGETNTLAQARSLGKPWY